MKCDTIAAGVVAAVKEVGPQGAAGRAARRHQRRARARRSSPRLGAERRRRRPTWPTARKKIVGARRKAAMSILVDKNTRVLVQGITGATGAFHTKQCDEYGTNVVAGVTPGKGGTDVRGHRRVRHRRRGGRSRPAPTRRSSTCRRRSPPTRSSKRSPPASPLVVCITEGIPMLDMVRVQARARGAGQDALDRAELPGRHHARRVQDRHHARLHPQAGRRRRRVALGHADLRRRAPAHRARARPVHRVGIGGDPVIGMDFIDVLALFEDDPDTHAVLMIGEIGGDSEEEAAAFVKANMKKPVAAFIAGQTAPPGKRMGHAGAIISAARARRRTRSRRSRRPASRSPRRPPRWARR